MPETLRTKEYITYRAIAEIVLSKTTVDELDEFCLKIAHDINEYPDDYDSDHISVLRSLCRKHRQLLIEQTQPTKEYHDHDDQTHPAS